MRIVAKLTKPPDEGKPGERSPAMIAGGWVHAGSLIPSILADAGAAGDKVAIEEESCERALP